MNKTPKNAKELRSLMRRIIGQTMGFQPGNGDEPDKVQIEENIEYLQTIVIVCGRSDELKQVCKGFKTVYGRKPLADALAPMLVHLSDEDEEHLLRKLRILSLFEKMVEVPVKEHTELIEALTDKVQLEEAA